MADDAWYFNRLGKIAPVSNPDSGVPNYGLTVDTGLAPWSSDEAFNAFAATAPQVTTYFGGATTAASGRALAQAAAAGPVVSKEAAPQTEGTTWNHIVDAAHAVGKGLAAGVGLAYAGLDLIPGSDLNAETKKALKGKHGFDYYKTLGEQGIHGAASTPGVDQALKAASYATDKANEYGSAGITTLTQWKYFTDPEGFQKAHKKVDQYHLNVGESFMNSFQDRNILDEPQRLAELRKNSTIYNFGALAFNVYAGMKYDPSVLAGKGLGAVRNSALTLGRLQVGRAAFSTDAHVLGIQRQIINAGYTDGRKAAEEVARAQTGLTDRVHAYNALSMYDRSLGLQKAAQEMPLSEFMNLPAFQRSGAGSVMAAVMHDVAHSDDEWNLVFRSSIGDPTALEELHGMRQSIADKINAIEVDKLGAEDEFQRALDKFNKRAAEQGAKPSKMDLTDPTNWMLDTQKTVAQARVNRLQMQLDGYQSKNDWLERATRGYDAGTEADSFFGSLAQVSPSRGALQDLRGNIEPKFYSMAGKMSVFQHDAWGPLVRLAKAPALPFLRRYTHVDLHDQEAGLQTIQHSLDQFAHVVGRDDPQMRDYILQEYGRATTDVSRHNLLSHMHLSLFRSIGAKYGVDPEYMDQMGRVIMNRRGQTWASMAEQDRWKTFTSQSGASRKVLPIFDDNEGGVTLIDMPMSVTDIANHFPMVNWLDIDHTLRMNKDLFKEMSKAHKKALGVARGGEYLYNLVGQTFNSVFKPLALISFRWPTKAILDSAYGIANLVGFMPLMSKVMKSAGYTFFNHGISRPLEMVKGRWVHTGSFEEEPLKATYREFDPFDHRAEDNPMAAVPFEQGDYTSFDRKRYDKLNKHIGARLDHYDHQDLVVNGAKVAGEEISPSMAKAVTNTAKAGKQPWEQQWEDRLAEAEKSDSRGFFFDPTNDKMRKSGFAVSVYPGRLKTFEAKPSSRELHAWMRDNSDVLSIPSNRVGVWLDKETGRWHLDVVRTKARREDAMLLAAQGRTPEFFDIANGFTRFMKDEDPYQHFSSPFAAQGDFGQKAEAAARKAAASKDAAKPESPRAKQKHIGFGKQYWRGPDGQVIEDEAVFGPDHENPNMYLSLTSARNYNQAMYGGHTVNLDALRRKHNIGKSTIEPGSGRSTDPQTEQWKESWATEMNRHFRFDPVWRRMLDGASDQEITDWLWSPEGRRMVRRRLLVANPREYVKDMRSQFDQMLPTDQARQLVRERTVSPDDVDAVIPHELREAIHADTLRTADRSQQTALWGKAVSWIYDHISSMPEDALVRHPFADLTYNTRLRNYYASLPKGTEITQGVQNAARASARAFTLKQVRRMLYNIAEENNAAYMMRYIMPFFQAHLEAVQRYFHIFTEKPEALARTAWLFNQSQTDNAFWTTVDENGKPANGHYSPNNKVIISARPWMRGLVNHIPGLKHALDDMGGLPVPAGSLDLMFQGSLINPGAGPLATLPAYEFYFKDHPGKDTNLFYKWLYGQYGVPRGSSLGSRVANSMLPAYLKRVLVAARDDETDSGYANTVANIMAEKSLRFEKQHGRAPVAAELDQMGNDAVAEAKGFYYLRSLVSFGSPLPIQGQVKHQYYIDLARQYKQKFGAQWQQKFFDKVGPEFYRFAVAGSQSNNGLNPTAGAAKTYYQLKPLIDQAPDLAGLIVGPQAQNGAFSPSVYQWQLNTKMGPGSSKTMREHPDARTEIANQQIETGWQEWGKVQAGVDAELAARGLDNVMQKDAQDVFIHMQEEKRRIIRENPAWEGAFLSRDANLPNIIHQMSSIAFNPKLNGRPDIMGLRKYLYSRQQMQKVLIARQQAGITTSASLYYKKDPKTDALIPSGQNQTLAAAWLAYTRGLVNQNPAFAEIYHRYLESDDLSVIGGFSG